MTRIPLALAALSIFISIGGLACSMCLYTNSNGEVLVGNNEDAWSHEARIFWTPATSGQKHGAAFVGHKRGVAQGGMNTAGLVYDGFTQYYRPSSSEGRTVVQNEFITEIMHTCATVHEVKELLDDKFISFLQVGSLWFIDSNGYHLSVEADTMILGHDSICVMSNFRLSDGLAQKDIPVGRYHRGMAGMRAGADAVGIMKATAENRARRGDGTLYTTIQNTAEKTLDLYFYHDYEHLVRFDLEEELAKGAHVTEMAGQFPENELYNSYLDYITPFNRTWMWWFMTISLGLIVASCLLVSFYFLRRRWKKKSGAMRDATQWLYMLVLHAGLFVTISILLLREEPYFLGMEAMRGFMPAPWMVYIPLWTFTLAIAWFIYEVIYRRSSKSQLNRSLTLVGSVFIMTHVLLWLYWDVVWI